MIKRLQTFAWDGVDLLRGVFDAVKWPFERLAWAVERGVVWPLRERTAAGEWGMPARTAGAACVALLVAGAVAFGAVRALDKGEDAPVARTPVSAPVEAEVPEPVPAEPVLEGPAPNFTPAGEDSRTEVGGGAAIATDGSETTSVPDASSAAKASGAEAEVKDPGPAAIEVARRFSGAFVLYETGRSDAEVREAFGATASPQLARALLQRPPRLPANVKVPKAKVLNVVPGPRHGSTFTLSASLLRVGVTSELRIDVQRDKESGEWRVTDVLG